MPRRIGVNRSATQLSVPSLLTGRSPRVAQPLWTEHPDNLFTLLAPTHELVMQIADVLGGLARVLGERERPQLNL